jgi:hypothetical protein
MKKLTIGLLAAAVIALAAAPADAASKKKAAAKKPKAKAEVAQTTGAHPMGITCTLNGIFGAKQPKACGG